MSVSEAPAGTQLSACFPADRVLAGCVRDYHGYEERVPGPVHRRELPSSGLILVVGFGDPVTARSARGGTTGSAYSSFVAGPRDGPVEIELNGVQRGVHLHLDPLTATTLLGVPMSLLSNEVIGLDAILGTSADRLAERIGAAPSWSRRYEILDSAFASLTPHAPGPDPAVAWTWRQLRERAGRVRIAALAEQLGWSRRHLVRRFGEQIGLPPKTVASIFRLERALDLLPDRSRDLADVALDAGYADQAHLTREVRRFTGRTPVELAAAPAAGAVGRFLIT